MVGAMDKVWSGGGGPDGSNNGAGGQDASAAASTEQQQARLAAVLQSSEDGEDVYVQVRVHFLLWLFRWVHGRQACIHK